MQHLELFSVPVLLFDDVGDERLNTGLSMSLLTEASTEPSAQRSNRGGWHSAPDLTKRHDPSMVELFDRVAETVQKGLAYLANSRGGDPDLPVDLGMQADRDFRASFSSSVESGGVELSGGSGALLLSHGLKRTVSGQFLSY